MICPNCKEKMTEIVIYPEIKTYLHLETEIVRSVSEQYVCENQKGNLECPKCQEVIPWTSLDDDTAQKIFNNYEV